MIQSVVSVEAEVMAALATVVDPELDEPITDLGFVRSVAIDPAGVTVHLRLPTSFCAPNFAFLMASDAQDALRRVGRAGVVRVLLDDHHDSAKINEGLAADAGYLGTFGVEADAGLDELRLTFRRKAHTAAMERCVSALLKASALAIEDLHLLRLGGLPAGEHKSALLRHRTALGLSTRADAQVVVDESGQPIQPGDMPMRLRFAKAVRISIEGNSHFCRGMLATRYADAESHGMSTRISNTRSPS
jgi:metal-sulfur cluster biosynthetic enzyme